MFPNDPNQPQQPYVPPQPNQVPQQAPNGQYEVVPPLPAGQNNGHSGHNPYEFIVNPNTPVKKGLFGGNDFIKKIAILVGGAVALFVVLGIIVSIALPNNSHTAELTSIVQKQQELIRVATLGASQASDASVKSLAVNIELSVTSNQQQLINYLSKHGAKLNAKTLALGQNAQTNQKLQTAKATNTLDSALAQELNSELASYEQALKQVYDKTTNKTLKPILGDSGSAAVLLMTQSKALANQ